MADDKPKTLSIGLPAIALIASSVIEACDQQLGYPPTLSTGTPSTFQVDISGVPTPQLVLIRDAAIDLVRSIDKVLGTVSILPKYQRKALLK